MKSFLLLAMVGSLCTGKLLAQTIPTDTATRSRQQLELKQALMDTDNKLAARQQLWLDAQRAKAKYDTIGLAQYREEMGVLKLARKKRSLFLCSNTRIMW